MDDINSIDTQAQSVTATICEQGPRLRRNPRARRVRPARRLGRGRRHGGGERSGSASSPRHRPGRNTARRRAREFALGFRQHPRRPGQETRPRNRQARPRMRDLQQGQDGSEVKARELELLTDRARNLGDRRDAFEKMRDVAAEQYRAQTGEVWRPRHGSNVSQTGKLTSAAIDARDFIRARKDRETKAHLPEGTLVAVAGGRNVGNPRIVTAYLDKARAKYANLVLVHRRRTPASTGSRPSGPSATA